MPAAKLPVLRLRALDLFARSNSAGQFAMALSIRESCLRRWMSLEDVDADHKEGLISSERKELVELRRRNRVFGMELKNLKRACAYFARQNIFPKH